MNCIELLRTVAPSSREPQDAIARGIERFIASDSRLSCVNAETGVGKTLAYAAPAVLAASRGSRVVVSTHTTQQLAQVLATIRRVAGALPAPIAVARRLGRANYISPGRIARILANRDNLNDEDRSQLAAARKHAGLIDAFEIDNGPLPLPHSDICLTSSCTNQRVYDEQRAETETADIVVQTHAMSVLDAVRGDVTADVAIYDEADALPSAAAGFAEARVSLLDLTAMALAESPELEAYSGFVEDSGEGRWTVMTAVEEAVPAQVLSAALSARFRSRHRPTFADKLLSAMRRKFGGHGEAKPKT